MKTTMLATVAILATFFAGVAEAEINPCIFYPGTGWKEHRVLAEEGAVHAGPARSPEVGYDSWTCAVA
ncbi:MAG: hypothetical protein ACT4PT_02880 [Methanobacteriota archaeon]